MQVCVSSTSPSKNHMYDIISYVISGDSTSALGTYEPL